MFKTKDVNATNSTHYEDTATESSNKVFILKQVDYNLWKFAIPILYVVGTKLELADCSGSEEVGN